METKLLPDSIFENLPDLLKQLTIPFVGRERDIVLLSSIGVLSASLPKVFGVYRGAIFYPNLFIMITAPPASGKGVMNNAKMLLMQIHSYIREISSGDNEDCKAEKKRNKNNEKCPDVQIKILPGNVSSSKIYKHIENSEHGLLMFETEADTLSAQLKQDWGNFSDVLRKAFQHESISISREMDDKYFEINSPKLSLVISGTPDQIKPLIQSKENGLYSRFIFYYFDEPTSWEDVSPEGNPVDYSNLFKTCGDEVFRLYGKLIDNPCDVEIKLTAAQWEILNTTMSEAIDAFIKTNKTDILPIIKRHGVMLFRITMILTIIRNKNMNVFDRELFCDDYDFQSALSIIKSLIDHSITVLGLLGDKGNLTVRETMLLASLPTKFKRSEAISVGNQFNVPERTLDYTLQKLVKNKILSKDSNGAYKKTTT